MGVLGLGVLLGVSLCGLIAALRAVRRTGRGARPDRARVLVALAARGLAAERRDWGQAMLAELDHIEGRASRWQFAIGCLWVALAPPPRPEHSSRALLATILTGVVACAAVVAYGSTRPPEMTLGLHLGTGTLLGLVLTAYVGIAVVLGRSAPTGAVAPRRLGLAGGVLAGGLWLIGSTPAGAIWPGDWASHYLLAGLTVVGVASAAAGGATIRGAVRTGVEVGLWSGLISSLVFCVGLLVITYAATDWLAHDPATVANFQRSRTPDRPQDQDIVAFLVRDNAEGLVFLVHGPLLGVATGVLGGIAGAILPPRRVTPRHPAE